MYCIVSPDYLFLWEYQSAYIIRTYYEHTRESIINVDRINCN